MKQIISVFLASLGLLISPCSIANDTFGAFAAGGIEFKKTTDISMQKEVLTISTHIIRVDYQFLNITNHTIKERIYFPTPSNYGGCHTPKNDFNFQLWVNGKDVETTSTIVARVNGVDVTEQLRKTGLSDDQIYDLNGYVPCEENWVPSNNEEEIELKKLVEAGFVKMSGKYPFPLWEPSEVTYWDQEFPPGQVVNISHEYNPSLGGGSGGSNQPNANDGIKESVEKLNQAYFGGTQGSRYCFDDGTVKSWLKAEKDGYGLPHFNEVEYILKTGANWAGPIKDFTLNLKKDNEKEIVSLCFDGHFKKTDPLTLTFHSQNFVPKQDLDILFLYDRTPTIPCDSCDTSKH